MANKKSNPIYPSNKHNYFGDFRVAHPGVESAWEKVDEANNEAQMANESTTSNNNNNTPYYSHNNFNNRVDIFDNEFAEEVTFDNLRDDYENVELKDEMTFGYDKDNYNYNTGCQCSTSSSSMNNCDNNNNKTSKMGQEEYASELGINMMVNNGDAEAPDDSLPLTHASIIRYKTI